MAKRTVRKKRSHLQIHPERINGHTDHSKDKPVSKSLEDYRLQKALQKHQRKQRREQKLAQ